MRARSRPEGVIYLGPEDVKKALVVGAGAMGNSIALVFARAGIEVALVDVGEEALAHAMGLIESSLNVLADAGKVDRAEIAAITGRVHPATELEAAARGADFVLEAVPEAPDLAKRDGRYLEMLDHLEAMNAFGPI
jgi:3-hydroxyacyl-CoA dehydrogenase